MCGIACNDTVTWRLMGFLCVELPILETLVSIRNRLSVIKRDKASYMRSKDIYPLWNEARDQLAKLKDIRGAEITPAIKRNRLDDLLEDVFMLLSLSFLSVGKCNESKHEHLIGREITEEFPCLLNCIL